jgi:hypothetical protein
MGENIKKILKNHERRISALEKKASLTTRPLITKRLSVKEFILSKNPKNDVDKTLTIGYFFEKYEKMNSFNAKDLNQGFCAAREKVPPNVNDKVNLNIKKGMMMEAGKKKDNLTAWVLTNKGEKFVKNDFKEAE